MMGNGEIFAVRVNRGTGDNGGALVQWNTCRPPECSLDREDLQGLRKGL